MSDSPDDMAPEASPDRLPKTSGVRRVNNLPMYLLGTVLGLFLLIMALVASDRSARQQASAEAPREQAGSTLTYAREIAGQQTSGIVEPARPPEVPALAGTSSPVPILIAKPDNLDLPPVPPSANQGPPAQDEEAQRIRMSKLQRLEEAAKARTSIPVAAARSAASAPAGNSMAASSGRDDTRARLAALQQQIDSAQRDDPTVAYQARLAQLRGQDPSADPGPSAGLAPASRSMGGGRNSLAPFAAGSQGDRWRLEASPEAPRTPYELRAGFVVPATLISGINSDLPGQIMGQVSQHVYDTATGKHLLIPQGARLVGSYASDVVFGQARVLVAWQRIVFPDGKAMDIGAMPGADSAGNSGFHDLSNQHYLRLFGSAFLMSGVTAGVAYSQRNNGSNSNQVPTAGSAMSEALGQQLGQVTAQLIARNMSIAPTLEIRPGYRFNVVVTKDLTFSRPYRSFDY